MISDGYTQTLAQGLAACRAVAQRPNLGESAAAQPARPAGLAGDTAADRALSPLARRRLAVTGVNGYHFETLAFPPQRCPRQLIDSQLRIRLGMRPFGSTACKLYLPARR